VNSGELDKAIGMLKHVIEIESHLLEETDLNRLKSEIVLSRAYRKTRNADEAIRILERIIKIEAMALGDDAQQLILSRYELAKAYSECRMPHKTIELLEDIVTWDEWQLPLLLQLVRAYRKCGQIDKAMELCMEAAHIESETSIYKDLFQENIGIEFMLLGDFGRAVELLEQAVDAGRRRFGEDNPVWTKSKDHLERARGKLAAQRQSTRMRS
jgi:tetratricopeptide (TPR) repeat protein